MMMHNPAHPGEILKELVIKPLNLSLSETADRLGVSRKTLSKIVNGHGSLTAEMALRLEQVFDKPDATHWLRLQNAYDLWQFNQRPLVTKPLLKKQSMNSR
jgi:addiction module HigA family antidote